MDSVRIHTLNPKHRVAFLRLPKGESTMAPTVDKMDSE